MVFMLAVIFPLVLLGLLVSMERVERPLRDEFVGDRIVEFLETARPEEVETFVSQGFAPALERYWRRRHRLGRLRRRPGGPRERLHPIG